MSAWLQHHYRASIIVALIAPQVEAQSGQVLLIDGMRLIYWGRNSQANLRLVSVSQGKGLEPIVDH